MKINLVCAQYEEDWAIYDSIHKVYKFCNIEDKTALDEIMGLNCRMADFHCLKEKSINKDVGGSLLDIQAESIISRLQPSSKPLDFRKAILKNSTTCYHIENSRGFAVQLLQPKSKINKLWVFLLNWRRLCMERKKTFINKQRYILALFHLCQEQVFCRDNDS